MNPSFHSVSLFTQQQDEPSIHIGQTGRIFQPVATLLVCLILLGGAQAQAAAPSPEDSGALEHYHHEFYSHSYVDPNYREDGDEAAKAGLSKSKANRKLIKPDTSVSVAFGGHRHRHHRPQNGAGHVESHEKP